MAKSNKLGKFNWRVPTISSTLIEGEDAPVIYDMFGEDATKRFNGNKYLTVLNLVPAQEGNPAYVTGSNVFAAARLDTLARQNNMRVATLADLSHPQILAMVKDQFYSDTPALVAQSARDSRGQNAGILKHVVELAEEKMGTVKFPFMVTGFDVAPSEDKGYGLSITPRDDFTVVQDDRFSGNNCGKTFNEADELGLPKFENEGKRRFYARNNGLSGLYLGRNLSIDSDDDDLAVSGEYGRVVLVRGEADNAKILQEYIAKQNANLQELRGKLKTRYQSGLKEIESLAQRLGVK